MGNFIKHLKLRAVLAKFFGIHILKEVKARHLLTISLSLGISTIVAGTIVFHREESWSLFDSFYYCVITRKFNVWVIMAVYWVSTIGLGDRVAAQVTFLDRWLCWFRQMAVWIPILCMSSSHCCSSLSDWRFSLPASIYLSWSKSSSPQTPKRA